MRRLSLTSLIVIALHLALSAKDLEIATPAAGVVALQGNVLVTPPGQSQRPCLPEEVLKTGWQLQTGPQSSADLLLWDKSSIRISQNTAILLTDLTETEEGNFIRKIEVATGRIWVDAQSSTSPKDTFEVKGPQAVAAVKGTAFAVDAGEEVDGTEIQVFEGAVDCSGEGMANALLKADEEFIAPVNGKARRARFNRAQRMGDDPWLNRNWQMRLAMVRFFKKNPAARARTLNLLRMNPEVRSWFRQYVQDHPMQFKPRPRMTPRPGTRPRNQR